MAGIPRNSTRETQMGDSMMLLMLSPVLHLLTPFLQAVTIPSSLLGLVGGVAYFGSLETDATKPIMVCLQLRGTR